MIIGECVTCQALMRKDIYGDLSWFPSPSCIGKEEHNLVGSDSGIEDSEEEIEEIVWCPSITA